MNSYQKFLRLLSLAFSPRDKFKLLAIMCLQIGLAVIDLLGVILFSTVVALTLSPDYFSSNSSFIRQVFNIVGISKFEQSDQIVIIGLSAGAILVMKSISSYLVSAKVTKYFSSRAALLSANIFKILIFSNLQYLKSKSSQHFIYATTDGVQSIMVRGVAAIIILTSDLLMFGVYIVGIFIVNPTMALIVVLFFGSVSYVVNHYTLVRAIKFSREAAAKNVLSKEIVHEAIDAYKEAFVKGRRFHFVEVFSKSRGELAMLLAKQSVISLVPKYVIDIALVVGSLLIGSFAFLTQPTPRAILLVSVFLLASARIVPALLRAQQGYSNIRSAMASTPATFELIDLVNNDSYDPPLEKQSPTLWFGKEVGHQESAGDVKVRNVQFAFDDSEKNLFSNLNFEVQPREFCAIVGRSGLGKTTLIELLLGLVKPQQGTISIGGFEPTLAISMRPWAIGYVPQDVCIVDGSLKRNVCLGFETESIQDSFVENVLKLCGLAEFCGQGKGIHSVVGKGGITLSGGQRQRVGLARALLTSPKLLILDEATSALDEKTETLILDSLRLNYPDLTVILVSHRSSAIKHFDKVIKLEQSESGVAVKVIQRFVKS